MRGLLLQSGGAVVSEGAVAPGTWVPVVLRSARTAFDTVAMTQPFVAPVDIVHIPRRIAPPPIEPLPKPVHWSRALKQFAAKGIASSRRRSGAGKAGQRLGAPAGKARRLLSGGKPEPGSSENDQQQGLAGAQAQSSRRVLVVPARASAAVPPAWLMNNPRACLWHPTHGVREAVNGHELTPEEMQEGWVLVGGASSTTGQALLDAVERRSGLTRRESVSVATLLPSLAVHQLLDAAGDKSMPRSQRRSLQSRFVEARDRSKLELKGIRKDGVRWSRRLRARSRGSSAASSRLDEDDDQDSDASSGSFM